MKKTILFNCLFMIAISFSIATAWNDDTTHPHITRQAVFESSLDRFMINKLSLPDGIRTSLKAKMLFEWFEYGAKEEDAPACRASNHFHNPYLPWQDSGLSDTWWLTDLWCWGLGLGQYPPDNIRSNITYLGNGSFRRHEFQCGQRHVQCVLPASALNFAGPDGVS